ncbi:MAG: AAA family ATPase [Spirochaetaceae bacterium]|nr:AAA family ATPase [Spirochaetaceae bacterium]
MDETPAYPQIPYGQADFRRIRLRRWLHVDKTRFLRRLEQEHYAFLIRPRRFGKSLWVSLLENYYDRFWAGDFDATFAGTDIGGPDLLVRAVADGDGQRGRVAAGAGVPERGDRVADGDPRLQRRGSAS